MTDFVISQEVAIYQSHFTGGSITPATVERNTKLYWIANGRKFRKVDGLEPNSRNGWDRGRYLLPLNDPRVIEVSEDNRKFQAFSAVTDAEKALAQDRENLDRIQALKDALDAYAEVLT